MKDNTKEARAGRATPSFMTGIDPWEEMTFECKGCGRTLAGRDLELAEMFRDLAEMACPDCGKVVALACFPTERDVAANLHRMPPEKRREAEAFLARCADWGRRKLHRPDQLPDIAADHIVLVWDETDRPAHGDIVIRFGEREIYRGPTSWEYHGYFVEACKVLRRKYGDRLYDVIPTERAHCGLWGDCLSAPKITGGIRRRIRAASRIQQRKIDPADSWENYTGAGEIGFGRDDPEG